MRRSRGQDLLVPREFDGTKLGARVAGVAGLPRGGAKMRRSRGADLRIPREFDGTKLGTRKRLWIVVVARVRHGPARLIPGGRGGRRARRS